MRNKYQISKLKDLQIWEKFEANSPQSSIFSSKVSLESFKGKIDLYEIKKGDEIKSLVYLFSKDKKNVSSTPLIYSGVLFGPKNNQKNCRYISEKFNLTEIIIEKILLNYSNLELNLHYNFDDIRPFQWLNFHDPKKPKFQITDRFTSIINMKNKTKNQIFENLDDVKQRDIKKCEKNKDISFNYETDLNILKNLYLQTMNKNNAHISAEYLEQQIQFLDKIYKSGKGFQTNVMLKDKIIYSNFFSLHNKVACYLYGAGDYNVKDRLTGTYCLWKSIEKCLKKNVYLIDLEGVNSPNRGAFKITFGGDLRNYYNVKINLNEFDI